MQSKPFFAISPGGQASAKASVCSAPHCEECCALGWIDVKSKLGQQLQCYSDVMEQLGQLN